MITCEICGTQAEQHDHWRHLIMARVAALEEFVTREPATDGQLASAGGAPKRCPHGVPSHLGCWNCTSHAVKVGYVVMDEPPDEPCHGNCGYSECVEDLGHGRAEQPSRQETGGGETAWECPGCACCNDDACPLKHADCEHKQPAEPSETGQLPSAPVCQCGHSRDYHVNGFHEARDCGFAMDRGGFCACARYREQAAANPAPSAPVCCVCGDDDTYPTSDGRRYCECCRCKSCGRSPADGNTCLCDYTWKGAKGAKGAPIAEPPQSGSVRCDGRCPDLYGRHRDECPLACVNR